MSKSFFILSLLIRVLLDGNIKQTDATAFIPESPYSKYFSECGLSKKGYLCDPDHILSGSHSQYLQDLLLSFPRDTPCLCRQPCFRNEVDPNARLVIALLILNQLPSDNVTLNQYGELVRKHWHLGACNGNEVIILYIGRLFHITYGPVVSNALNRECIKRLATRYDGNKGIVQNVRQTILLLREFFVDPCLCRSCKAIYSWFKIPAMLLACFCLLTWLSLVGRRAYLRRNNLLPNRSYCSISDLTFLSSNRTLRLHRSSSSRPSTFRTHFQPHGQLVRTNSNSFNRDNVSSDRRIFCSDDDEDWFNSVPPYQRTTHLDPRLAPPPYSSVKSIVRSPPTYSEAQNMNKTEPIVDSHLLAETNNYHTSTPDTVQINETNATNNSSNTMNIPNPIGPPPPYSEVVTNSSSLLLNTSSTSLQSESNA